MINTLSADDMPIKNRNDKRIISKTQPSILINAIFNFGSGRLYKQILIIIFLMHALSAKVSAQVLEPVESKHHNLGLNIGLDNNLISLNLGYAYYVPKYRTAAFIDYTQGSSLVGTGNFRMKAGMLTWQGSFKKFTLRNSIAFVYMRSVNKAGNYDGLGLDIIINPGFRFKRIGIGADLQYNPFFATHIQHTALYRTYYYENVKDGWYKFTAHNVRVGLYMSTQLGEKKTMELNIRGGYQSNGVYDKLIPNVYAIVGVNKSF